VELTADEPVGVRLLPIEKLIVALAESELRCLACPEGLRAVQALAIEALVVGFALDASARCELGAGPIELGPRGRARAGFPQISHGAGVAVGRRTTQGQWKGGDAWQYAAKNRTWNKEIAKRRWPLGSVGAKRRPVSSAWR